MSYSYKVGQAFSAAGTVAITSGSVTVAGTGTAFDAEFSAGDYVTIAGETRLVATVESATSLTVTANFTTTASAQAAARVRLTNVESLGLPPPRGLFTPFTQAVTLGDGSVRGAGWKAAEWKWGFVTRAQRDILRAYCPGASAEVFISTRSVDSSDAYGVFRARMLWPQQEEPQAGRRLDFSIKFQGLIPWP